MRKPGVDWPLLWSVFKGEVSLFFIMCFPAILCAFFALLVADGEMDLMAIILFCVLALGAIGFPVLGLVMTWSSISYYYGQKLLRKYGVQIDGILTKKEAQCRFMQEHDQRGQPQGDGYHLCDLYIEFEFQLNGAQHEGAFYLNKADLFDKLQPGDRLPLLVLRYDPTVQKVRERRLANMLKGREPEVPSRIPEGAEIGQAA